MVGLFGIYHVRIPRKSQKSDQMAAFAGPGLLVTRHLTPELARHCKRIGLQFIDAAGKPCSRAYTLAAAWVYPTYKVWLVWFLG